MPRGARGGAPDPPTTEAAARSDDAAAPPFGSADRADAPDGAPEPPPDLAARAHALTAEEVVRALRTDVAHGLSEAEARSRLAALGPNELARERTVPAWRRFLAQFQDVLVVLLLVAMAISGGLWLVQRETTLPYEALAILAVVLLNAALGFFQERRAEAAVEALRAMSAREASVVRDGEPRRVPAADLVPGDVLLVEGGDTVAADARIVEATALRTAEAALTGESLPVAKDPAPVAPDVALGDRTSMLFSGTAATYGRGRAVVTATGMRTEMGRIAHLLQSAGDEPTPLQRELDRTGRLIGAAVVVIAAIVVATIVAVQDVRGADALFDVLILGVALAVAAVPEGLPAVVAAVLSLGVQRMAARNAIVRHLAAVETLGSASVIASDKTGTLTRNEMAVRVVVTASGSVRFGGSGYEPRGEVTREDGGAVEGALAQELELALTAADLANNAVVREQDGEWIVQGDPTEAALLVAARKAGLTHGALEARLPRLAEVPFSSERKLMSTLHREAAGDQRLIVFTKGAPDVLLARCAHERAGEETRPLTEARRREITAANETLARRALRTLAVAYHDLPADAGTEASVEARGDASYAAAERDLVFAGLIGMMDPPRAEARAAVDRARAAGIRPVMVTGDHPGTATVIAQELGITEEGRRVLTGPELDALDDAALASIVGDVDVYARVNPEHKLRIVAALRAGGAVVAVTGDGVNDAPALRSADIGVAMGLTGTDVSREAADMVLADDNFATIVAAVEEGRAIFANIRKFLRYLLSSNIGEVLTMFFGVVLAGALGLDLVAEGETVVLPLLATQILWINLVTDGPPALALGVDPPEAGLMTRPPRAPGEGAVTAAMWRGILFVGVVMAAGTLFVLDRSLPGGFVAGTGELSYGQTMAFTTLMLFQVFNVLNARSDERSAFGELLGNRWLWGAVALSLALQALVVHVPFLQVAFGTVGLAAGDWLLCAAVASSVLWLREGSKALRRVLARNERAARRA